MNDAFPASTRYVSGSNISNNVMCYAGRISINNGVWQSENPLIQALPVFVIQLTVLILFIRFVLVLFRPLNLPCFVPEILGGVFIGRAVLGQLIYWQWILPLDNIMSLETMSRFGLVYYAFLVGLETDISSIMKTEKKALKIAGAGIMVPFTVGFLLFNTKWGKGLVDISAYFEGTALSVTSVSLVFEILEQHKLLHGEIGGMAQTAAIATDAISWILLAAGIPIFYDRNLVGLIVIISFSAWMHYVVGPIISRALSRTVDDDELNLAQLSFVMAAITLCGFMADACGTHSLVGAFFLGTSVTDPVLRSAITDRLDYAVYGLVVPLFCMVCGLRVLPISLDHGPLPYWGVVVVILVSCFVKPFVVTIAAVTQGFSFQDAAALGLIMNAKGIMAIVMLDSGFSMDQAGGHRFFFLVLMSVALMSSVTTPILKLVLKPSVRTSRQRRRTIEGMGRYDDFRILACVYSSDDVPGIVNLLRLSNATPRSPISATTVHLVELTSRAPVKFFFKDLDKPLHADRFEDDTESGPDLIVNAFKMYERENGAAAVHVLRATLPYANMKEGICNLAEDKAVSFVVLPFHQKNGGSGSGNEGNTIVRSINQSVLAEARCSVGILIDRGIGSVFRSEGRRIAVVFVGGPDDREALYYAWRMAGRAGVSLSVFRFVPGVGAAERERRSFPLQAEDILTYAEAGLENERQIDDEFITKFREETENSERIRYSEVVSNDCEETVTALKLMDHDHYDLYIVGKSERMWSPLTAGLDDWSDWPELGAIGDILVSSEFAREASVLVMQRYTKADPEREVLE